MSVLRVPTYSIELGYCVLYAQQDYTKTKNTLIINLVIDDPVWTRKDIKYHQLPKFPKQCWKPDSHLAFLAVNKVPKSKAMATVTQLKR